MKFGDYALVLSDCGTSSNAGRVVQLGALHRPGGARSLSWHCRPVDGRGYFSDPETKHAMYSKRLFYAHELQRLDPQVVKVVYGVEVKDEER